MKKFLALFLILLSTTAYADVSNQLNIEEEDGSPSTFPYKLKVSAGTLTDNGDGTASLTTGGGGSGGSGGVLTSDIGAIPYYITRTTISEDVTHLWAPISNTMSISADRGQVGKDLAIVVSTDTGARVANISHDGTAFFNTVQLSKDNVTINAVAVYTAALGLTTITADTVTAHSLFATSGTPAFRQALTSDISGVHTVSQGGTNLSSGISGGIPYFKNTQSMDSSALLAANAVLVGGGAGNAPVTITADATAGHVLVSTATTPNFRQLVTGDSIGTIPVATGGTGITSGNSGGIPYFSNSGLMASSAALTSNALVTGGGAGTTPATITADTVTTHALFATSTTPAFRALLTSDVVTTGIVGSNMGGTGQSSYTKGDILVGNTAGLIKIAVGANGTVLSADSSQTNGVIWVAPPTGGGGSGDMILASAQTNTGVKTFNAGTIKLPDLAHIADGNGASILSFDAVASAVNRFIVVDAATATNPTLSADGADANIGINLNPKGTSGVVINASTLTPTVSTFAAGLTVNNSSNTSSTGVFKVISADGTAVISADSTGVTISGPLTGKKKGTMGWSVVAVANQACSTTCTYTCAFGEDTSVLGSFVDCSDATADRCVCMGPN